MTKKLKGIIATGAVVVLGVTTYVVSKPKKADIAKDEKLKVTLILDEGGVNDQSFNQSAWEGALKSQEKYDNVEVSYLESHSEADYLTNIDTAVDNESDLIVGVGFKLKSTIETSADNYPEQKFAIIDEVVERDNVVSITFNEEESGYLVGLIAGKTTKTNKLGFIGGMDIPSVTNFAIGFEKGAKEVNPEITVVRQYANSFTDAAKGKAIAAQMLSQDIDIIFSAGGGVNSGVFETCIENGIYAIGVDSPSSHIAPETILTSALKNVGAGIGMTIDDIIAGEFKGGQHIIYDMSTPAIDFEKTPLLDQTLINEVNFMKELKLIAE